MYRAAEEQINKGLSSGARGVLGFFSGLFGVVMILVAPPTDKAVYFYMFGAFCLLITLACFTKGRARQLIGSILGCALFVLSVGYLVYETAVGPLFSGSRSASSILNALFFVAVYGIPGAAYAYKARFGLGKRP